MLQLGDLQYPVFTEDEALLWVRQYTHMGWDNIAYVHESDLPCALLKHHLEYLLAADTPSTFKFELSVAVQLDPTTKLTVRFKNGRLIAEINDYYSVALLLKTKDCKHVKS